MTKSEDAVFRTVRGYQLKNQKAMKLTSALEDYLEMAYRVFLEEGYVRVGGLSKRLHVKPSSSSKMVLRLVELGYLKYDRYSCIVFTDEGEKIGAYLLARHNIIERFLQLMGSETPLEEAELVEHTLSPKTIAEIGTLIDFFEEASAAYKEYLAFRKTRLSEDTLL